MDLKEIGAVLQSRRQELGLALEDIQKVTKIRIRYLRAIEAGDDSVLPALPYTQGFIRAYASYVGLDGHQLAVAYRLARQQAEGETPQPQLTKSAKATMLGGAGRSRRSAPALPRSGGGGAAAQSGRGRGMGSLLAGILVVVAMMAGTAYVIKTVRGQTETQPGIETVQPGPGSEQSGGGSEQPGHDNGGGTAPGGDGTVAEEPGRGAEGEEGQVDEEGPAGDDEGEQDTPDDGTGRQGGVTLLEEGSRDVIYAVAASRLEVEMATVERSWAEVWVDGEKVYEWFFEAGETHTYQGRSEIRLWAGNPGGVNITVNGEALGAYAATGPRNLIFRSQVQD